MNPALYTKEQIKALIGIKSDTTLRKYIKIGKVTITHEFSKEKRLFSIGLKADNLNSANYNNLDDMDFSETA